LKYPRKDTFSTYNTNLDGSMNGSDHKFLFLNFIPELMKLSRFPSNIIKHTENLRKMILIMDDYNEIKVRDIFTLYDDIIEWTKEYVSLYGSINVTSKVHKLEHIPLFILLVISLLFFYFFYLFFLFFIFLFFYF
jgi:hypothetical protein